MTSTAVVSGSVARFSPVDGCRPGDLAIDVGTAAIRVADRARLLVNEPAVVARGPDGAVLAAGHRAFAMLGRAPQGIEVVEPICHSAVRSIEHTHALLQALAAEPGRSRAGRGAVALVTTAGVATVLQQRALLTSIENAFPRHRIVTREAALAAALGAGHAINAPRGSMIVDVGRGSTETAIVALGEVIRSDTRGIGTRTAEVDVTERLEQRHGVVVGRHSAERLVRALSSRAQGVVAVRGVERSSGTPTTVHVCRRELRAVVDHTATAIAAMVRSTLDAAPVGLAADVVTHGVRLTGGGARLAGVRGRIAELTGLEVRIVPASELATIRGARLLLAAAVAETPSRRGRGRALSRFRFGTHQERGDHTSTSPR